MARCTMALYLDNRAILFAVCSSEGLMNSYIFGHRFGEKVVDSKLLKEIRGVISSVSIQPARGKARSIKSKMLDGLRDVGWSMPIRLSEHSGITITSSKNGVGLCQQVAGNMARGYADLLKLQTLYQKEVLSAGVFLMPTKIAAEALGDNVFNYDRIKREMVIFEKTVTIPLVIIGWE